MWPWLLTLLFLLGGAVVEPDARLPVLRRLEEGEDGSKEEGEEPDIGYVKQPEDPDAPDPAVNPAGDEEPQGDDAASEAEGTPEPTEEYISSEGNYEPFDEDTVYPGTLEPNDATLEPTMEPMPEEIVLLDDPPASSSANAPGKTIDFIVGSMAGQEDLPDIPEKKGSATTFIAVFVLALTGAACCCYCKRRGSRRKGFEKLNPNPPDDSDDDLPMTGSDLNLLEMAAKTPRNAPGVDMREEEQKLVKFIEQNNLLDARESLGRSPGRSKGSSPMRKEVVLSHAVAQKIPHQDSFGVGDASSDEVSSVSEDEEDDSPPSQVMDSPPARPATDPPEEEPEESPRPPQEPEPAASAGQDEENQLLVTQRNGTPTQEEEEETGEDQDSENAPLTARGRKDGAEEVDHLTGGDQ